MAGDRVVHHIDYFPLEEALVPALDFHARQNGSNLELVALRDLVAHSRELFDASLSCNMAEYIGLEEIGDPAAVIWQPSPLDQDWFKRLKEEGHSGKRILLATGSDVKRIFGDSGTCQTIRIPARGLTEKVYKLLKR